MRPVTRTVTIDAPPGPVWDAMVDVEGWPTWASYMARLERLDARPLAVGSRVTVIWREHRG
jgi:uncharacterized protein YndB with AHSA1/START domain